MQNNILTSEEVKEIIDNLYNTIGVRMNINLSKYPDVNEWSSVNQSSFLDDCKIITEHLELPIHIIPIFSSSFETKGVVYNQGNGTSGIGAQVHIPNNIPWYKTESMKNYPINVTIPPEALDHGHFFLMTGLSHEFSHIYLYSRRDPQKESEWATDLCSLMMGFSPLWFKGRKHTWSKDQIVSYTQTQGYLSDDEYNFAVNYIDQLRSPFEHLRKNISSSKQKIQSFCNDISKYLEDITLLYDFHLRHPQEAFKHPDDIDVFSRLAQSQYKLDVEILLKDCKYDVNSIIKPLSEKKEFYESDKKWMEDNVAILRVTEEKLEQKLKELQHDYDVLIQNIDVEYHTNTHNIRIETLSKGIYKANQIINDIINKMNILDNVLEYYKRYKKKSYSREADGKTLSLVCHVDYSKRSKDFIEKEQKKIDEIDVIIKKADKFYSVDDSILETKMAELNDALSTFNYCLKEQKNYIKVVMRNLNFMGRFRCIWNRVFSSHKTPKTIEKKTTIATLEGEDLNDADKR